MKIVIFYFSGTGNTWWASSILKSELESLGNTVEMYSLENPVLKEEGFTVKEIEKADQVIVGFPIYGSDLPTNMMDFIHDLPKVSDGKKFGAFCTQAGFSGDGCIFFKKDVEEKGYKFLQSFQIDLTTNFNVAMLPFSLSKPAEGDKLEKIKAKASIKIKKVAGKIAENKEYLEGKRFYQVLLGGLERAFFRRGKSKLPDKFKFSKDRCIKCRLCVNTCPTENLFFELWNSDLKRKDKCLLCFRCYNFCPSLAINYGGKIKAPEKYRRFTGPIQKLKISDIRK